MLSKKENIRMDKNELSVDLGTISEFFEYYQKHNDPTTRVTLKHFNNDIFELMYITVCKFLEKTEVLIRESEVAEKILKRIEKDLKDFYKAKTKKRLTFKQLRDVSAHERIGYLAPNGSESYYFRLFRTYQISSPKNKQYDSLI